MIEMSGDRSPTLPFSGKFGGGRSGQFGESSAIRQTETIQINTYN